MSKRFLKINAHRVKSERKLSINKYFNNKNPNCMDLYFISFLICIIIEDNKQFDNFKK
uniref:Uncharacterized protein n=1 Tax=Meloidogyne enterolobii TaxID=390850 RepID=A0A6V7WPK0_MELEN|nr:unnamed protein product [Meloidogyne enterolobii]